MAEDSAARVVHTDSGRQVKMSYRRGCHDYAIGYATAFFMAAAVLGYVILWKQHLPTSLYATAVPFFVVFSMGGFALIAIGYSYPVRFYELMEGEA